MSVARRDHAGRDARAGGPAPHPLGPPSRSCSHLETRALRRSLPAAARSPLTAVTCWPTLSRMGRRMLMSVVAVVAMAGLAWGVTKATSTEVTTVGVKIRRAPPQ
jgi:hypothetical protein